MKYMQQLVNHKKLKKQVTKIKKLIILIIGMKNSDKLLQLRRKYSMFSRLKINVHKSIVLLCINKKEHVEFL